MGMGLTGGAADIYKCFDQLSMPLIHKILEEAGMPTRVLETYSKYLEALTVYNTTAGGLGEACSKPTSIPQWDAPVYDCRCNHYAGLDYANAIICRKAATACR